MRDHDHAAAAGHDVAATDVDVTDGDRNQRVNLDAVLAGPHEPAPVHEVAEAQSGGRVAHMPQIAVHARPRDAAPSV
jgi:hypothetical protein